MPLSYTPRKFIPHPHNGLLYLIEGDHRVMSEEAANKQLQQLVSSLRVVRPLLCLTLICHQRAQGKMIDEEMVSLPPEQFGRPKAPMGTWASCICIINPLEVSLPWLMMVFMC